MMGLYENFLNVVILLRKRAKKALWTGIYIGLEEPTELEFNWTILLSGDNSIRWVLYSPLVVAAVRALKLCTVGPITKGY